MKTLLFHILTVFLTATCITLPLFGQLKKGDLIFQTAGSSGFSDAISQATASEDSLQFIHIGIIDIDDNGNISVIEASPEAGVRIISLEAFLDKSARINGRPGAVVKRLTTDFPAQETIILAKSHLGEEYDWWYLPDNHKMYCSELVYESYRTEEGDRIFKAKPMNFRASDGSMPEFWTTLFGELGTDVPEGVDGTNPNDMAKDPCLIEILRYF